jgi:hypothetical protein
MAESLPRRVAPSRTGGTLADVMPAATFAPLAPLATPPHVLAADAGLLLGDDLIVWILLALGGAMFAGNVMALVRPPGAPRQEGDLERAPRGRSLVMAAVGLVVAVAALAALVT